MSAASYMLPISVLARKLSWNQAFLDSVVNDQIKLLDFSGDEVFCLVLEHLGKGGTENWKI